MRVAAVSHTGWLGGAERCLVEGAAALVARGHEVAVAVPGEGPLHAALQAAGARTATVPSRWWARDPGAPRRAVDVAGAQRTVAWLRGERPDVVLSNTLVQPAGALAARALGLPHVWWVHELGDRDHGFRFALGAAAVRRAVHELSAEVVVGSRTVADHLGGTPRVVAYAVDVPAVTTPPPARDRATRLVLVGRVRPSKGHPDAVAALARLPGDVELTVVGDGFPEDLAALRAQALELGVGERLHLRGPGDPLAAHDAADVVLVPSRLEAFGRVTVEAHKRGKPVVGAASGGTGELLRASRGGLTHPPGDPAALAARVLELLDDPALRARLAAAGHAHAVGEHTTERLGAQLEAALRAAIDRAPSRRGPLG